MAKSGNQTEKGKAFEYACANVIAERYKGEMEVVFDESKPMETAKRCYAYLQEFDKLNYTKAAKAAIKIIDRFEPHMSNGDGELVISLQADSLGIAGDVRDVICRRGKDWQIGLSCKHNHEAVKHSRLSDTIDFGKEWFDKPCSAVYFEEVKKIFGPLRKIRDESKEQGVDVPLWDTIGDKEGTVYIPVLRAFMTELKRLDKAYPGEIPALLVKYLMGNKDFYKVIMNDKGKYTQVESININGTLGQSANKVKSLVPVPVMKLPKKFYEIEFKEDSNNTVIVVCDQGWNISMRIHNASSKIEPSLKFDVQLLAMPNSILNQYEPWE